MFGFPVILTVIFVILLIPASIGLIRKVLYLQKHKRFDEEFLNTFSSFAIVVTLVIMILYTY